MLSNMRRDIAGEFDGGQPSRVPVSMGVMWSYQTAYISLKKLCRSLPVQNKSSEHSPCVPGNAALPHEKEKTERPPEIFSFIVLIQTPFEVFLLISS